MPIPNAVKWVGVQPTSPEESIPVKAGAEGVTVSVQPVSPAQSIPVKKGTDERKAAAINGGATVSVGATSTTILAANSARVSYYVENIGNAAVYIYLGSPATTSKLTFNPGDYILGDDYTGIITGITATGSQNVYVVEV